MVHISILEILSLSNGQHFITLLFVQELTLAVEQFQGVPLTGVMTGSDDDAAIGTTHAYSQLGGRRSGQSDIDHIKAVAHQCSAHHVLHHLARDAGITTHHDGLLTSCFLLLASCFYKCGIRRYELDNV